MEENTDTQEAMTKELSETSFSDNTAASGSFVGSLADSGPYRALNRDPHYPDRVLIGSAAIALHLPGSLNREPKDKDYLSLNLVKNPGEDLILGQGIVDRYPFSGYVASLDELYTLKVSHSAWVIGSSWQKHLFDIVTLKRNGAKLIPELHDIAYAEWERRKGVKRVNLNKDKEEFFHSGVRRKYIHDSIHAAVAFYDEPLFNRILFPGAEVKVSRTLFEQLSEEDKARLVQEETMVLALERELIPADDRGESIDKYRWFRAYQKQLQALLTELSKGWFPMWSFENFDKVARPPHNYWKKFSESDKKVLLPKAE